MRKIIKFIWMIPAFLAYFLPLKSQQNDVAELYQYDYFFVNPAVAGLKNCQVYHLSDHHQWLGLKNAPNVQTFAGHTRLEKKNFTNNYHGIGGQFYRDKNGHYQNLGIQISYAFHFLIMDYNQTHLSLGLSASYIQQSINQTDFNNYYNDPIITGTRLFSRNPDAAFGLHLYNPVFFTGFYATRLLPRISLFSDPVELETNQRNYGIYISRIFYYKKTYFITPGFMYKTNEKLLGQVDINLKLAYEDIYWLGFSYRHTMDQFPGTPLSTMIYTGFSIQSLDINYSFSVNLNNWQLYNYGSHSILITYRLCKENKGAVPCPF